jgi:MOSC domain-containing protein YiiM
MPARLISVNAGRAEPIPARDRMITTAIRKQPQPGRVPVDAEGLVPDEQADRRVHGGTEQALYAYASEDYAWWTEQLQRELPPGMFGENLTTEGIDVSGARIGERWRIGEIVVEASGPRTPCATFAARMGEPGWPRRFTAANRPGAYFRVLELGTVSAGDAISVLERPEHDVTVADVARIYMRDRHEAERLCDLPALMPDIAAWARLTVDRLV